MDEWAKTLLSAGAGFTAGLLSEGLKSSVTRAFKRRQMRQALYQNFAPLLVSLEDSNKNYDHEHRLDPDRLEVFDYYYNSERATFYQLEECAAFSAIYKLIRSYTNETDAEDGAAALHACLNVITSVTRFG